MSGMENLHSMCLETENCTEKISLDIQSEWLNREVRTDAWIPRQVSRHDIPSLLLINDGQLMEELGLADLLETALRARKIRPLVCIAIHAGSERKQEYGTAGHPNYLDQGSKAEAYTRFVFEELLPAWRRELPWQQFHEKAFAGFSLGGLSALDITWAHPHEFSTVGVFSGSLWWRNLDQDDPAYDDDKHRIMHQLVRRGHFAPWLRFFFETGILDETSDRNGNGIIDSIDDTLGLIAELEAKGYPEQQIRYLELSDGRHDVATWARAMPLFLEWAFPSSVNAIRG